MGCLPVRRVSRVLITRASPDPLAFLRDAVANCILGLDDGKALPRCLAGDEHAVLCNTLDGEPLQEEFAFFRRCRVGLIRKLDRRPNLASQKKFAAGKILDNAVVATGVELNVCFGWIG